MANRASGRSLPADHVCCCIPATADEIMDTISQVEEELAPPPVQNYTFRITADPSDATIKINGTVQSSITVEKGTTVSYEVSKGMLYNTVKGSYRVNSDYTLNVHLEVDIELRIRSSASIPTTGGDVAFGVIVHSTGSYMNAEAYELVSSAPWLTFNRVENTNYYMTSSSNTGDARESRISLYLKEEFWDEYQGQHQYYKELYGVELDFVTVSQAALVRDSIRLTPGATDMRFREAGHELLNPLGNIIDKSQLEDWEVCGTIVPWGYLDDPNRDEPINRLCEYQCNIPEVIIEPGDPDSGSHVKSHPGGYFWIPKGVPDETNLIFTATWRGAGSEGQDLSASIERTYYKYLKYSGLNIEYVSKDIGKLQFKATVSERKMVARFQPGDPEYVPYVWKWDPQTSVIDVTSDPRLTWSVVSPSGVTSDGNGLFTIPYSVEDGATITVKATFTKDDEFDNYSLTDQASTTYEEAADPILRLLNNTKMTGSPEAGYSVSGIDGGNDSTEQFTWDVENPRPDGRFVLLDGEGRVFNESFELDGEMTEYKWKYDAPEMFKPDGVIGYKGTGETGEFSIQIGENPLVNGLVPKQTTLTARYYYDNDTKYVEVPLTFNWSANPKLADVTCTFTRNWEGLQTFSIPAEGGKVTLEYEAQLINNTTPGYLGAAYAANGFWGETEPWLLALDGSTWNKKDDLTEQGIYNTDHTTEWFPVIGSDNKPDLIYDYQDYSSIGTPFLGVYASDLTFKHEDICKFTEQFDSSTVKHYCKATVELTVPENTTGVRRGNRILNNRFMQGIDFHMPSGRYGMLSVSTDWDYYNPHNHESPLVPDWHSWCYGDASGQSDSIKSNTLSNLDIYIVQEAYANPSLLLTNASKISNTPNDWAIPSADYNPYPDNPEFTTRGTFSRDAQSYTFGVELSDPAEDGRMYLSAYTGYMENISNYPEIDSDNWKKIVDDEGNQWLSQQPTITKQASGLGQTTEKYTVKIDITGTDIERKLWEDNVSEAKRGLAVVYEYGDGKILLARLRISQTNWFPAPSEPPVLTLSDNDKMTGSPQDGYSVSGLDGGSDSTQAFTWQVENPWPDGHFVLLDEKKHVFYEDYEHEDSGTESYLWILDAPEMFKEDGVTGHRGTGESGGFSIQIGENPLVNGLIPDPATITARYYYNDDTQYVEVPLTFNYSANPKLANVTCTISRNWNGRQTFTVPAEGGNVSLQMTAELVNHTTPGYLSTNSFYNYTPIIIAYDQSTWDDYNDSNPTESNSIAHTEENYPVIGQDGNPSFIYNFQDFELTTSRRLRGSDVKSHPEILTFEGLLEDSDRTLKYNIIFTIPENTTDKSRGNHIRFVTAPDNIRVEMPSGTYDSIYYLHTKHETPIIPDWDEWYYGERGSASFVDYFDYNIVQEANEPDEPVDETDISGLKFTSLYTDETPGHSSKTLWDSTKPGDPIQTITVPASGGELIIDVEKRLIDENGVVQGLTVTDGSRDQGDSFNSNVVTALYDINDAGYLAKFGNDLKPVVGDDGQGRWIWTPENAQESTTSGADLLPTYNATVNVYDEPGVGWTRITITVPENTTGERRGNDIVIIDRCTLSYTSQNLGETVYVNERNHFINGYNEENPYYDPSLGGSSGAKYYADYNRYGYFIIEQEA